MANQRETLLFKMLSRLWLNQLGTTVISINATFFHHTWFECRLNNLWNHTGLVLINLGVMFYRTMITCVFKETIRIAFNKYYYYLCQGGCVTASLPVCLSVWFQVNNLNNIGMVDNGPTIKMIKIWWSVSWSVCAIWSLKFKAKGLWFQCDLLTEVNLCYYYLYTTGAG